MNTSFALTVLDWSIGLTMVLRQEHEANGWEMHPGGRGRHQRTYCSGLCCSRQWIYPVDGARLRDPHSPSNMSFEELVVGVTYPKINCSSSDTSK